MTCTRKIGPFDCCSVVQGDCLELMADVPFLGVALIADPPYGIDYKPQRVLAVCSKWKSQKPFAPVHGDNEPFDPEPFMHFPKIVLFGANHYASRLPDSGGWIVWDKKRGATLSRGFIGSDAELIWTNCGGTVSLFQYMWNGLCRDGEVGEHYHPTQKPIALMEFCIEKAGNPETVLDPYCGSGSTLVAAKKLGRHFLGFEISAEYCQIARDRLARIDAQPTLFEPKAEQMVLA